MDDCKRCSKVKAVTFEQCIPANICWSSKHVLKMSSTCLRRNNLTSSKTSWRHLAKKSWRLLEDVFKTSRKTSSRRLGRRKIVMLKTSWRRLEDQQMFAGYCTCDQMKRSSYDVHIFMWISWTFSLSLASIRMFLGGIPLDFNVLFLNEVTWQRLVCRKRLFIMKTTHKIIPGLQLSPKRTQSQVFSCKFFQYFLDLLVTSVLLLLLVKSWALKLLLS